MAMLYIQSFTFNAFRENTYVVHDDTRACIVVDPGCYERSEQQALHTYIEQHNLKVTGLVNTHAHIDHVVGNHYIQTTYGVPLALHAQEVPMLQGASQYAASYGFTAYQPIKSTTLLATGDVVLLGTIPLTVLHVPGHSPGHIALYNQQFKLCIAGDILFKNSIGRTDLPGGDHKLLLQSIHQQLFSLEDNVTVYPGHGPTLTIGEAKREHLFANFDK